MLGRDAVAAGVNDDDIRLHPLDDVGLLKWVLGGDVDRNVLRVIQRLEQRKQELVYMMSLQANDLQP